MGSRACEKRRGGSGASILRDDHSSSDRFAACAFPHPSAMSHPSARGRVRTNTMTSKGKTLADFAVSLHKVSGTPPPSLVRAVTSATRAS